MRAEKSLISFSSNDYLGLSQHPEVIKAAVETTHQYGTGAGASRLVTGNHPLYAELEATLAHWKKSEACLVFGSGYLANLGVIPALVGKGDGIFADRLVHASLLDGARLSGADILRCTHNNMEHLESLLKTHRTTYRHCLILVESVYSMDGDCAPLDLLSSLAKHYDAWLMVDDAHGLGMFAHDQDIYAKVDIYMGTLSKALGGYGGYICGSQTLINYLLTTARSFIYTTGLPPSVIASALAALRMIESEPEIAKKPLQKAKLFTDLLNLPEAQSCIVPLILHEEERVLAASDTLEKERFLVTAIRPPTVPPGTARLRFAFSALHKEEDIRRLAAIITREGWV